MLQPYLK